MFSSRTRLTSTVFWCHLERVVFGRRGEKSRLLSNFHTRMWYVILCSIFWWHQNYLRYACISYTAPPLLLCILLWWLLIIAVSVLTVILAFTSSRCVFCYVYFNMLIFERTYWESVWMENSYCLPWGEVRRNITHTSIWSYKSRQPMYKDKSRCWSNWLRGQE